MPACSARPLLQANSHSRLLHSATKTLTVLHKASAFVPKVLTGAQSQLWKDTLNKTYNDVLDSGTRPSRVVVFGLGQKSGARELVTATLDEPLKPDTSYGVPLRARWVSRDHLNSIEISYGSTSAEDTPQLHLPSSFLLNSPNQVYIVELSTNEANTQSLYSAPASIHNLVTLNNADIPVVVWNPLTLPASELRSLDLPIHNPNMILAVTAAPSPSQLSSDPASAPILPGTNRNAIYLDPNRAIQAVNKLRANATSPSAIQSYQDDYVNSNVSLFKEALRTSLDKPDNGLHTEAALSQVRSALVACRASLRDAKARVDALVDNLNHLQEQVEQAKAKAHLEVFGVTKDQDVGAAVNEIQRALKIAERNMKHFLGRLSLWRTLWRIDEVSEIVSSALTKAWCRDLEKRLILQTGRLMALQETMRAATFSLLSAHSDSFNSPVLQNKLLQLTTAPTYGLTPATLTAPLQKRASQITEFTTPKLHVSAQRAVTGMTGGVAAGLGIVWAGWFGWLTGIEGLLSFATLDTATSIGVGGLVAATSIRWAVGRWERAKQRWWEDWHRVCNGLDRDLKLTLEQVMSQNVIVVAQEGTEGLMNLADAHRESIDEMEDELEQLMAELDSLENSRPSSPQ